MAKKRKASKASGSSPKKTTPKLKFFSRSDVPDRISRFLDAKNLVPPRFKGTDKFLDIVSWNIRWFDHQDDRRIEAIQQVLSEINGDIFVLVEIAQDGALDDVVKALAAARAGYYSVHYGTTGDQQRVAIVWDRDWVRSKRTPSELFAEAPTIVAEDGRRYEVFPRRPLWGYFESLSDDPAKEGFTFELVGVHLKSQMQIRGYRGRGGIRQRSEAAKRLVEWIESPSEHFDEDVLIIGDWNAKPDEDEWKPFEVLEKDKKIDFRSINPREELTHIARLNKSGPGGTRLDLHLITKTSDIKKVSKEKAVVIHWSFFDQMNDLPTQDRQTLFKAMKMNFSDHLPVVSRFYFTTGRR
jgi:endonuclease/exonuclease/phosphatase family metal-dependent hydrolase